MGRAWQKIRELSNLLLTDPDIRNLVKRYSPKSRPSVTSLLSLISDCARDAEARKYLIHAMTLVIGKMEMVEKVRLGKLSIRDLIVRRPKSLVLDL